MPVSLFCYQVGNGLYFPPSGRKGQLNYLCWSLNRIYEEELSILQVGWLFFSVPSLPDPGIGPKSRSPDGIPASGKSRQKSYKVEVSKVISSCLNNGRDSKLKYGMKGKVSCSCKWKEWRVDVPLIRIWLVFLRVLTGLFLQRAELTQL